MNRKLTEGMWNERASLGQGSVGPKVLAQAELNVSLVLTCLLLLYGRSARRYALGQGPLARALACAAMHACIHLVLSKTSAVCFLAYCCILW